VAGDQPFVIVLGQHRTEEAQDGARLGKMPTTALRRLSSLLRRSKGLVE
jgi:hypothetical protein